MQLARVIEFLKREGPRVWNVANKLPKIWAAIDNPEVRTFLRGAMDGLRSRSPITRLRSRIEVTVAVARSVKDDAADAAEQNVAESWIQRGEQLRKRLDIPVTGRQAWRHRQAVKRQLNELLEEMGTHLESKS